MSQSYDFTLIKSGAPWEPAKPTEAELLAIDRTYALAKEAGILDLMSDLRALLLQIKEEPFDDPDMSYGGSD